MKGATGGLRKFGPVLLGREVSDELANGRPLVEGLTRRYPFCSGSPGHSGAGSAKRHFTYQKPKKR